MWYKTKGQKALEIIDQVAYELDGISNTLEAITASIRDIRAEREEDVHQPESLVEG